MKIIRTLAFAFCVFGLLTASPDASAGLASWCRAFVGAMEEGKPISDQWIVAKAKDDQAIARQWLWRENEKDKTYVIGINMVSMEQLDFLLSVPNWKSLNNAEVRSLLRVHNAIAVHEFLEMPAPSFAEALRESDTTLEDVAVWRRVLPGRPLPE